MTSWKTSDLCLIVMRRVHSNLISVRKDETRGCLADSSQSQLLYFFSWLISLLLEELPYFLDITQLEKYFPFVFIFMCQGENWGE